MSAHPAPRATRAIRAETAGSSGLALGPNKRGKGGGEVEASIPVMAMAHRRTRGRVRRAIANTKSDVRGRLPLRRHSGTLAHAWCVSPERLGGGNRLWRACGRAADAAE